MKKILFRTLLMGVISTAATVLVWTSASAAKEKKGAASGAAAEGQKIFRQNCTMCHYADKTDTKMGPGLKGLLKNKQLPESHKPATDANVREQVVNGSPNAKPMAMPPFKDKLSPAQIDDLVAYLKTL